MNHDSEFSNDDTGRYCLQSHRASHGDSLDADWTLTGDFLETSWRLPGYFLDTSWILPGYFLDPYWTLTGPFLDTDWTLTGVPVGGLFLALFWNPLFPFFWENGSPK